MMKKKRLLILLICAVMVIVGALLFVFLREKPLTPEELAYQAGISRLEQYLLNPDSISIAQPIGDFAALEHHIRNARSFEAYCRVLSYIEYNDYTWAKTWMNEVKLNPAFPDELEQVRKEHPAIGSVEQLEAYMQGCKAEYELDIAAAKEAFEKADGFFDSKARIAALDAALASMAQGIPEYSGTPISVSHDSNRYGKFRWGPDDVHGTGNDDKFYIVNESASAKAIWRERDMVCVQVRLNAGDAFVYRSEKAYIGANRAKQLTLYPIPATVAYDTTPMLGPGTGYAKYSQNIFTGENVNAYIKMDGWVCVDYNTIRYGMVRVWLPEDCVTLK